MTLTCPRCPSNPAISAQLTTWEPIENNVERVRFLHTTFLLQLGSVVLNSTYRCLSTLFGLSTYLWEKMKGPATLTPWGLLHVTSIFFSILYCIFLYSIFLAEPVKKFYMSLVSSLHMPHWKERGLGKYCPFLPL